MAPKKRPVPSEALKRMNFLYQVSQHYSTSDYGQFLNAHLRHIGEKTLVRLDPSVKRSLCKQCHRHLVPGTTATVDVDESVTWTCNRCGFKKTNKKSKIGFGERTEKKEDRVL